MKVSFLGPSATFSHLAAMQQFGLSAQLSPERSIPAVFEAVEKGEAYYGVVPVENSTEGAVNVTLDRLIDSDVSICGERYLTISQHLLSHARELRDVKTVLSHPQGLAQCRQWRALYFDAKPVVRDCKRREVNLFSFEPRRRGEKLM